MREYLCTPAHSYVLILSLVKCSITVTGLPKNVLEIENKAGFAIDRKRGKTGSAVVRLGEASRDLRDDHLPTACTMQRGNGRVENSSVVLPDIPASET